MSPPTVRLPDGRVWLRIASPSWTDPSHGAPFSGDPLDGAPFSGDPLDPSYARDHGGRWNPPGSFAVLYLNGDVATARSRLARMLEGSPVTVDDLDDDAYVLVAATLPRGQACADATNETGLDALGLPVTYPLDADGQTVGHEVCRPIGQRVKDGGLRGVWCRSAATDDGSGREVAWFPATVRSRARTVWRRPRPLGAWRHATRWEDLGLPRQPEPKIVRAPTSPA